MPTELWDRTYNTNVRGTYLTIKHFLKSVEVAQKYTRKELPNVSVVVTGSESVAENELVKACTDTLQVWCVWPGWACRVCLGKGGFTIRPGEDSEERDC